MSKTPDPALRRMKRVAKDFFELPSFEDQDEWEVGLLLKLEAEQDEEQQADEGGKDERD